MIIWIRENPITPFVVSTKSSYSFLSEKSKRTVIYQDIGCTLIIHPDPSPVLFGIHVAPKRGLIRPCMELISGFSDRSSRASPLQDLARIADVEQPSSFRITKGPCGREPI